MNAGSKYAETVQLYDD